MGLMDLQSDRKGLSDTWELVIVNSNSIYPVAWEKQDN